MSIKVDARGLLCPQPVIATKKALDSIDSGTVTVIVDNLTAKQNVTKLAVASNCGVVVDTKDGYYYLTLTKTAAAKTEELTPANEAQGGVVYLITRDTLGHGSNELGAILMKSFMYTLTEQQQPPKALLFLNAGVRLTSQGSPVAEHLQTLSAKGVEIVSCGTCLDYYQLKDKLVVGTVGNMYQIVSELTAGKAITL